MKIVILAGGTGSIALQTGLYSLLDRRIEGFDIKVIVNAYDNGLSTGAVRRVLNGNILGPSDVRKNQTTRFNLENANNPAAAPYSAFLDHRFSAPALKAEQYCVDRVLALKNELMKVDGDNWVSFTNNVNILFDAVSTYFDNSLATQIDYDDFALSNIIYAGLAAENGNSLRAAAKIMAGILGIKDNVILNDDASLFLGATTSSGKQISDEGDIVSWNNTEDPIVGLTFTDSHGHIAHPILCDEARNAIIDADLIILSSGTQWSSLIPTYESSGFLEAIEDSEARVMMIMNRFPDKDAPSATASDIIRTLVPKYFPEGRLEVIIDSTGGEIMRAIQGDARMLANSIDFYDLSPDTTASPKHHPKKLAMAIAKTYHKEFLNAGAFVFDYDDTLVGRGNSYPHASCYNARALLQCPKKVYICSGNSIKAIKLQDRWFENESKTFTVFADGGINQYEYTRHKIAGDRNFTFVQCLDESAKFDSPSSVSAQIIVKTLCTAGISASKIENRGDVIISIKPIDPEYRVAIHTLVENLCDNLSSLWGGKLVVKSTGRTTVEIHSPKVNKIAAINLVLSELEPGENLVYVGDEFISGNDKVVKDMARTDSRIKCLTVRNPADTTFFLKALTSFVE